jgi:hypothetical protein
VSVLVCASGPDEAVRNRKIGSAFGAALVLFFGYTYHH